MSIRGDAARREREASFSTFFAQNWMSIRRHITLALIDDEHAPEDVEELVSEVFLLAWQRWDGPRALTLRWLEVVADNKIRDRRRRHRVSTTAMLAVQQTFIPSSSGWDEWDRLAVRSALTVLKGKEQQALALLYSSGWSTKEIGRFMNMAPSAVGAMLSRARAKLRRTLDAHGADALG